MPCCAAINCSNRSERGIRLFRFPSENTRRSTWVNSMRRKSWIPTSSSLLCEKHFEESQYEGGRADGWRKLKPNAVPTLFDVPNPPPKFNSSPRKSLFKCYQRQYTTTVKPPATKTGETTGESVEVAPQDDVAQQNEIHHASTTSTEPQRKENHHCYSRPTTLANTVTKQIADTKYTALERENEDLKRQLEDARQVMKNTLERENQNLRAQLDQANAALESFLNKDQIQYLKEKRLPNWPSESIVKGLKFRFGLSVHGYNFLRESGYPLPSYSTLARRMREFKLTFGIFKDILEPLKYKVASMEREDKYCLLSYDEMVISGQLDFDKNQGNFFGNVTLGDSSVNGDKIFTVLLRGVKNPWKQVVGCHVTPRGSVSTHLIKDLIVECVAFVESCCLHVVALSSDMDNKNRSLWTSLNIAVSKDGLRTNSFSINGHDVFAFPDACHLLKNLKAALLRQVVHLPDAYVELENLPSKEVRGSYVVHLWNDQISRGKEVRTLHHLHKEDVEPSHFDKMNVSAAVRFFSIKTAAALETAVKDNVLAKEALTTASFIRLIEEWFSLVTSKVRKTSITRRNCDRKFIFLHTIIDLFQEIVLDKFWKPLNYGMILATMSFCDVAEFLFSKGFEFVLGHRFTQDAVENIFSQIRNKEGNMPSALKCLRALKTISVSQYVSDVKRTSYLSDSDTFLVDFFTEKGLRRDRIAVGCFPSDGDAEVSGNADTIERMRELDVGTVSIEDLRKVIPQEIVKNLFHLAGSAVNAIKKGVCADCCTVLREDNFPQNDFLKDAKLYTSLLNRGGLNVVSWKTFYLILHCEYFYNVHRRYIFRNGYLTLRDRVVSNVCIDFPTCCDIKCKLVKHFFTVRSYCVKSFSACSKKRSIAYGSASVKRFKK